MAQLVQLVGSTVTLSWSSTGTSDATLAVIAPDGSPSTPSVNNTASPVHTASLTPERPGLYTLKWATMGGELYVDVLDVWPESPRYLVSSADCQSRLRATTNGVPRAEVRDSIQLLIASATWVIEKIAGPQLPESRTYKVSGDRRKRQIVLPNVNVAVTSVTVDGVALAESAYTVDEDAGIVISDSLTPGDVNIAVAYTVGSAVVAPPARTACIELVAHMFGIANYGEADINDETSETPSGFLLPRRVTQLLQQLPRAAGMA